MNPAILQQPFFQVTLPLMVTFVAAIWYSGWSQGKGISELSKRLDDIIARLGRIEQKLESHSERITRLEERTSPIGRRP